MEGNSYLGENFPKLSYFDKVTIKSVASDEVVPEHDIREDWAAMYATV